MARILVVDDEILVRTMVREAGTELGHEVLEAGTLSQGMGLAATGVDLVLLDVMLPDGDGLAHVPAFAMLPQQPEVLVVTGFGHAEGLASALHSGAMEYLVKPLRLRPLQQSLQQALNWREDKLGRNEALTRQGIVGKSRALREALSQLAHAAASHLSVLIQGETGSGKEVFARTLHASSLRSHKPLITVDCASLPENLLESQLFGHAKGAFTGADRSQEGLLRAADGGTLFLDEVGELPLSLQSSFLRALDVRRFRPIGEKEEVSSDFRVVAATNKNLQEMAREQAFRSDLLFRLQGIIIQVPPLRERKEDILELAEYFLAQNTEKSGQPKMLGTDLADALQNYYWHGNVRELSHLMSRD